LEVIAGWAKVPIGMQSTDGNTPGYHRQPRAQGIQRPEENKRTGIEELRLV